jgi:plastocyanin
MTSTIRTLKVLVAIGVLAAAGVACSGSDNGGAIQTPPPSATPCPTPSGTPVKVEANANLKFSPANVTVKVCESVDWKVVGAVPHTVTSPTPGTTGVRFDSGTLNEGQAFTFSFATPGTYHYYCTIHTASVMSGTITVTS